MRYLMGIDMGGTVVKTAVYDLHGNEIAVCGEHIAALCPRHDQMERDVAQARERALSTIRRALKEAGISGADVIGIGVTGQGNGAYLFDAGGQPVRNGIMSSDTRAKEYIKRWYRDGVFDKIYPLTYQTLWSGNLCALIAWLRDNEPESLQKTAYIVTAKDYVRYLLTGEFRTELTEGSGTSCMELKTHRYSETIFRALGIGEYLNRIPDPIGSCEIGGHVTGEAAALTGLEAGTPVVGGQFDVSASTLATGVVREGQMGIVVGSWGINTILRRRPVNDPQLFMQYLYAIPDVVALMEGSATSASNLEWFIDACMTRGEGIYAECDRLVASAPYRDSLIYLPYVYGTNVHIDAKGAFVGLHGGHGQKHMLRAVYEGVAFCHRLHIERLEKHGDMPGRIHMAGGATRSAVWMQLFADVLGREVEVSKTSELGTMSVAMCAGIGCGVLPPIAEATLNWARTGGVYAPDPEKTVYYKRKYAAFKTIIASMDAAWSELDDLIEP